MKKDIKSFRYDWGGLIVDFVKKKDLDSYEWADCWSEDYDWTAFDLYIIANFFDEVVSWGMTRFGITIGSARTDLRRYVKHYGVKP